MSDTAADRKHNLIKHLQAGVSFPQYFLSLLVGLACAGVLSLLPYYRLNWTDPASSSQLSSPSSIPSTLPNSHVHHSSIAQPVISESNCLVFQRVPQLCPVDERVWSESIIHPAILWHPHPRRVLILGSLGAPLVAESLRHFTLTHITWVTAFDWNAVSTRNKLDAILDYFDLNVSQNSTSKLFQYDGVIDELSRVLIHHGSFASAVNDLGTLTHDVVIMDHLLAKQLGSMAVNHVNKLTAKGGVVAIAHQSDGDSSLLTDLATMYKRVYIGMEQVHSIQSNFELYYATKSDLHVPLNSMSTTYVNTIIARRILDGQEDLQHYDGESHLRLFSLPRQERTRLHTLIQSARTINNKVIEFPTTYEPSKSAGYMKPHDLPGNTILREYFDCDEKSLADLDELSVVVKRGLTLTHTKVLKMTKLVHAGDEDDKNNETVENNDDDSDALPEMLSITAILGDGHYTLRTYPRIGYAAAEYTSFDQESHVYPEEIMGIIGSEIGALRTVGVTVPRGYSQPGPHANLDFWFHDTDYYMSPKVLAKMSPTAGRGNFAGEDIKKGEILFQGPIETYLRHDSELEEMPSWRSKYINHMGEQAEDDVWIAPPMFDEDKSYYTNHNCNANLIYQGYDTMVARRDIAEGEELTFEYSSADAEPHSIMNCNCGAPTCRGKIHGDDWMRKELVENYGIKAFWPHIQKKILRHHSKLISM